MTVQRRARARVAEREVEDGAHVVGELRGDRAVLGPVAGVVRAHGQLVDQDAAVAGLEQLDREVADDAELLGDRQGQLLGLDGAAPRRGRARGRSPCRRRRRPGPGLDDRVGDGLAVRGAHDVRRQLPDEVDLLLGEDGDAGPEGLGGLGRVAHDPHALAVVAAADGLQDDREAVAPPCRRSAATSAGSRRRCGAAGRARRSRRAARA